MNQLMTQFTAWVGRLAPKLDQIVKENKSAKAHAFMLREAAEQSKYLMSEAEEALAAELSPERRQRLWQAAGHRHLAALRGL